MPLTPNFEITQSLGVPESVDLEDNSTGSDGAITQRRVYIAKSDGTFLVPSGTTTEYIAWSYSNPTITIDCLDKDYGVTITVQWLDVSNAVLYDKTIKSGLTLFNETYDYGLTQQLAGNPPNINDNRFFINKGLFRTLIDSGDQAISLGGDTFSAQLCYDRATEMRLQGDSIFNINS